MLLLFIDICESALFFLSEFSLLLDKRCFKSLFVRLELLVEFHDKIYIHFLFCQRFLNFFVLVCCKTLILKQFALQSAFHFGILSAHLITNTCIFLVQLRKLVLKVYDRSGLFRFLLLEGR